MNQLLRFGLFLCIGCVPAPATWDRRPPADSHLELREALRHADAAVRRDAVQSIHLTPPHLIEPLCQIVRRDAPDDALRAMDALLRAEPITEPTIRAIAERMQSAPTERDALEVALRVGGAGSLPPIIEYLSTTPTSEESEDVRWILHRRVTALLGEVPRPMPAGLVALLARDVGSPNLDIAQQSARSLALLGADAHNGLGEAEKRFGLDHPLTVAILRASGENGIDFILPWFDNLGERQRAWNALAAVKPSHPRLIVEISREWSKSMPSRERAEMESKTAAIIRQSPEQLPRLLARWREAPPSARLDASVLRCLAEIGAIAEIALPDLLRAMAGEHADLAVSAIASIGPKAIQAVPMILAAKVPQRTKIRTLVAIGPDGLASLRRELQPNDPMILDVLDHGLKADPKSWRAGEADMLQALMSDQPERIARAAQIAHHFPEHAGMVIPIMLRWLGSEQRIRLPETRAMNDATVEVPIRSIIAEGLGQFGPAAKSTISELRKHADDANPLTRRAVLRALLRIDPNSSVD